MLSSTFPPETNHLDLSGNSIRRVDYAVFQALSSLERLNLAHNRINQIDEGAFSNLTSLRFLNLSMNSLGSLDGQMLMGLVNLEKLSLSGNRLARLDNGTFGEMPALKSIDLGDNPLICDCRMRWLAESSVGLSQKTVCHLPSTLQGLRLRKVSVEEYHCDYGLQLPVFELEPSVSQVVFVGDPLRLRCKVSDVEETAKVFWEKEGLPVNDTEIVVLEDEDIIWSVVDIERLEENHKGNWMCNVVSDVGNATKSVAIAVISQHTKYCNQTVTSGNKGQYVWPMTVTGVTVKLPCWHHRAGRLTTSQVLYRCNENSSWEGLDTSECLYVSEVTKVLEQLANLSGSSSPDIMLESARRLRNYTGHGIALQDKMDVVYIAQTMHKFLQILPQRKEIAEVLIDVVSSVMKVDKMVLRAAQLEDQSCTKLVQALMKIPESVTDLNLSRQQENLAVEQFTVKVEDFPGVTCISFLKKGVTEKQLRCSSISSSSSPSESDATQVIEASIKLPASLFQQVSVLHGRNHLAHNHKLQFVVFRNAKLFPRTVDRHRKLNMVTGVVGSQISALSVYNLTDPVIITMRAPSPLLSQSASLPWGVVPVWWDINGNGNLGEWKSAGCELEGASENLVTFHCDRLANYGLLQDVQTYSGFKTRLGGAPFRLSHPTVYLGCIICNLCIASAFITYIIGFSAIGSPKKSKHSLINTWLSIAFLCLTFTFGVRQTVTIQACQAIGLLLHYFSMTTLVWMIITASNLYKKLTRNKQVDISPDEPLPDHPPPAKPMMRFYMVGWGVPIIVCGISGAVNMQDYAGQQYCFLAFGPNLGAFFGPCAFLVLVLCIFYLLLHCVVRVSEASCQRTANVLGTDGADMELVNAGVTTTSIERAQGPSSESGQSEPDTEHSPRSQLRAQAVQLLLLLSAWAAGATVTVEPLGHVLLHEEAIFGVTFAILASALGVFIFTFYCLLRSDVRHMWKRFGAKRPLANGDVEPLPPPPPALLLPSATANGSTVHCSNYSLDSMITSRSGGSTSRSYVGVPVSSRGLVGFDPGAGLTTDTSWAGELFYNPYQNGVARKFFRKQSMQKQDQPSMMQHGQHEGSGNRATKERTRRAKRNSRHGALSDAASDNTSTAPAQPIEPFVAPPGATFSSSQTHRKKRIVRAFRVAEKAHPPMESIVSSSSQGPPSLSRNTSGNSSDRSLLILEEEQEQDDGVRASSPTDVPNGAVDGDAKKDEGYCRVNVAELALEDGQSESGSPCRENGPKIQVPETLVFEEEDEEGSRTKLRRSSSLDVKLHNGTTYDARESKLKKETSV